MGLALKDRVRIKASTKEESKMPMFRQLHGKVGTITEIYYMDYQPETERYEVTLDEPVLASNGEEMITIPGLYEDNLEKLDKPQKPEPMTNRAVESFRVYESKFAHEGETKWYYGMADCHGIISLRPEPGDSAEWGDIDMMFDMGMIPDKAGDTKEKRELNRELNMMMHTARINAQRHTVVFRAKVSEDGIEMVEGLMASSMYEDALKMLKDVAEEVQVARGTGANTQSVWDKIPNPELDPMY